MDTLSRIIEMSSSSSFLTLTVRWCPDRNLSTSLKCMAHEPFLTPGVDSPWKGQRPNGGKILSAFYLPVYQNKFGKTGLRILHLQQGVLNLARIEILYKLIKTSITSRHQLHNIGLTLIPKQGPVRLCFVVHHIVTGVLYVSPILLEINCHDNSFF